MSKKFVRGAAAVLFASMSAVALAGPSAPVSSVIVIPTDLGMQVYFAQIAAAQQRIVKEAMILYPAQFEKPDGKSFVQIIDPEAGRLVDYVRACNVRIFKEMRRSSVVIKTPRDFADAKADCLAGMVGKDSNPSIRDLAIYTSYTSFKK
ncbi:MAG TPA: hypothetical protein VMV50_03750 [Candidatus Paceibacterota bacterium]|nr:hypothetical protein [Candidatus Paceibacterota bacterium]